jgi:acylpyruvate hydrolase
MNNREIAVKIATIQLGSGTSAARLDGEFLTILPFPDVGALLASGEDWKARAAAAVGGVVPLSGVIFAPLIPHPEKIMCVGLNYRDHAEESGQQVPEHPTLFAKYSRSLIGANDEIMLPEVSKSVDWEIELGVVVGRSIRNADAAEAASAIAGYTIINDVSMRDWQMRTPEWLQGKTFERSTPIGPFLVTPEEVDDARALSVHCMVDEMVVQQSNTDQLIFTPAEILAYASTIITMVPGDVIATGTPGGIGAVRTPPKFLQPGQTLVSSIEGLGELSNTCSIS